jgi:hypothetical protein
MPKAPASLSAGVIVYFLAMAGISTFCWQLSSAVTAKVVALSLPYMLDKDPSKPSRVEQRRIDVTLAVPPMPVAKVVALEEPAVRYDVLAAQLDLAETQDLASAAEATLPAHLTSRGYRSPTQPSTALSIPRSAYSDEMMSLGVGQAKPRRRRVVSSPSAAEIFNRSFGVIPVASNY